MFSSLRTRLIIISVSIIVIAMLAVAGVNYATTRKHTLATLNEQMEQLSLSHANAIGEWINSKRTIVHSIRQAINQPDPTPALLAADEAGAFINAYIGYPNKRAVFSRPAGVPADYDPTARPWYIKAMQSGGPILTPPYPNALTGVLVVTVAEPVDKLGVVAANVPLDSIIKNVLAIKPTPNSLAFLVDGSGTVIAHPDKQFSQKPVSAIDASLSAQALTAIARAHQSQDVHLNGRSGMLFVAPVAGTDWMLAIVLDRSEATSALAAILTSSGVTALILIALAALVLSVLVARALRRMQVVRDAMEEIASGDGDLTRRLEVEGKDELAQIACAFNRFIDKIASALGNIRTATESVSTGAEEIARGNLDLSSRTEEGAGSLEQTAASMEQLTSTVKQNAGNAQQANRLAASASEVAQRGGAVVANVVSTMATINESSGRIADIIGVIDGIAFQTNILALNAAVEAARAGEQGRGFAVVATEVRSLAQRSASAAREIKTLIDSSVSQVADGSKLVEEAGATMQEVVASVRRVTEVISEITAATEEQSAGIEHVNQAITQMDQVTQQNAALVEQAAAAADSLQEQAGHLRAAVNMFKLSADKQAARKPAPAALAAPAR